MATKNTAAVAKVEETTDLVLKPETLKLFATMASGIPESQGDATDGILLSILGAKTWDELDDAWDTTKSEKLVDKEMRIDTLIRRPSEYAGGLGVYLVVQGVDMTTNEPVTFTTGAISVVGQLVGAYFNGWLPLYAILRRATKPTANGYYPQHLEFIGKGEHTVKAEVIDY